MEDSATGKHVRKPCSKCIAAKVGCDHKRPCSRCVKRGEADLCFDIHNNSPQLIFFISFYAILHAGYIKIFFIYAFILRSHCLHLLLIHLSTLQSFNIYMFDSDKILKERSEYRRNEKWFSKCKIYLS